MLHSMHAFEDGDFPFGHSISLNLQSLIRNVTHLEELGHGFCEQQEGVSSSRCSCKGSNGTKHVEMPHRLLYAGIDHHGIPLLHLQDTVVEFSSL